MRKAVAFLFLVGLLSAAQLVYNETQVYRHTLIPVECQQGEHSIVFWREMRAYNVTTVEGGIERIKHFTTFTLYFKNEGNQTLKDLLLKEHLPEMVAETPEDIANFSITPHGFEQGSVVVTWMFENVEPGETRSVSYTVEKELNESVLDEFETPKVVVAASNIEAPSTGETGFDWTTPVIAVLTIAVAGLIYYFTRGTGYQA